jgi:predicted metal-binding membrane protein
MMAHAATLKRDRTLVLGAMVVLIVLSWAYTVHLGLKHASMADAVAMPAMTRWSAADALFMLIMWSAMMFAMMLPSVTPTVMIFGRVREKREAAGRPFAPTGAFVAGYLLAWVGFSVLATGVNWWLHTSGSLSSMMGKVAPLTGGVLLIAAGVFQWTPLKNACLDHCRSPMSFLMQHWREGLAGATWTGLHHGAYCLGCCWLLMVLLFVLGVMNLPWVAVVTVVVLAEKTLPHGELLSRGLGMLLIAWGTWLVAVG